MSCMADAFLSDLSSSFVTLRRAMEAYMGGDLSDLSAQMCGSSEDLEGDDVVASNKDGLRGIIEALAKPVQDKVK